MTPSIFCKLIAYFEANEYDFFVDNSYVKRYVPANHIFWIVPSHPRLFFAVLLTQSRLTFRVFTANIPSELYLQIIEYFVNPQNQAWLEGCATPECDFFFIYLKTILIFIWLVNFQTSSAHCLYSLDPASMVRYFFQLLQLHKRWTLFSKKSQKVDHVLT